MVRAVMSLDLLLSLLVLVLLVVFFVSLVLYGLNYISGHGPGSDTNSPGSSSEVVNRLDEMARIAISRRPRTRKRRHRQHHTSKLASPIAH